MKTFYSQLCFCICENIVYLIIFIYLWKYCVFNLLFTKSNYVEWTTFALVSSCFRRRIWSSLCAYSSVYVMMNVCGDVCMLWSVYVMMCVCDNVYMWWCVHVMMCVCADVCTLMTCSLVECYLRLFGNREVKPLSCHIRQTFPKRGWRNNFNLDF